VGAYALSEAASGSDAFSLTTRATADGLTGRKMWITNAAEAEIFLVFATVDPLAGYKGITCFIVERGMPGFAVGKKEDKLGMRLLDVRINSRWSLRADSWRAGQGLQDRD